MTDMRENNNDIQNTTPYWDGDAPVRPVVRSRNRRFLFVLLLLVVGMVGFAFANARYFGMLCEAIGFGQYRGGDFVPSETVLAGGTAVKGREIEVLFVANVQGQLPVTFRPVERVQKTLLGQTTVNDYKFVNVSNRPVYFMPIHNYRPAVANNEGMIELGKCFCFEPQMLRPEEEKTLPLVYMISPKLDASIPAVTFYYTLFEMTENDYNEWWAQRNLQKKTAEEQS